MSPDDRRDCAAQILWCGLALGPARLDQRLQVHPCSVRQHRSSSHQEEQNVRNHNRFKREQALGWRGVFITRLRWLPRKPVHISGASMRKLVQHISTALGLSVVLFNRKREPSPTRDMELRAAARRERQKDEARLRHYAE